MLAVFNKTNKKFLFFVAGDVNLPDKYDTKDVGNIDPVTDTYWGDIDTGYVLTYGSAEHVELLAAESLYDEKIVIAEKIVREAVQQRINEKHHYTLDTKLDIIIEMLEASSIPQTAKFKKMVKTLKVETDHLSKSLQTYASDDSFVLIPAGKEQEFIERQLQDEILNNL